MKTKIMKTACQEQYASPFGMFTLGSNNRRVLSICNPPLIFSSLIRHTELGVRDLSCNWFSVIQDDENSHNNMVVLSECSL